MYIELRLIDLEYMYIWSERRRREEKNANFKNTWHKNINVARQFQQQQQQQSLGHEYISSIDFCSHT